jgi:hypothetical protein
MLRMVGSLNWNFKLTHTVYGGGGLISLWLYNENKKLRDRKNIFTLHIPRAPHTHTYDFVVLTSLTNPGKILLVVLQIGKAKDLSAPLGIGVLDAESTSVIT